MQCVFIYDTAILKALPRADRRVEFIHGCIAELDEKLRALGGSLIVRHGDPVEEIPALAAQLQVDAVFCNADYEPYALERDSRVAERLLARGCGFTTCKDHVIFEKDEVLTQGGKPFSVFTPYKNAWLKRAAAEPQCMAPWPVEEHAAQLAPPNGPSALPGLEELGFARTNLRDVGVHPGMSGAQAAVDAFLPRLADYGEARNYPAIPGTSMLSVHLRFGTVSIRQLVRSMHELIAAGRGGAGAAVWLSELVWREFYQQILYHNPHVVEHAYKPAYERIEFDRGPQADALFAAWCEGRTGYPLVDAAMLQLKETGFMHNRLRMVTASFLVKDLGIDWRRGERFFALHLNDYELGSNNGGWQWAASTGCDAQPYFRIFNPITQSQKFDARGEFIRHYLPQLRGLSDKEIHAPWLKGAKVDYPAPVVEHEEARRRTLARYAVVKGALSDES